MQFRKQVLLSRLNKIFFFSPSAKKGVVIEERTDKQRHGQAGTVRYGGVSIRLPNPLTFEDQPNILFTRLPLLAEACTHKITETHTHTHKLHKVYCTMLLVYRSTSLVDTLEPKIPLGLLNKIRINSPITPYTRCMEICKPSLEEAPLSDHKSNGTDAS